MIPMIRTASALILIGVSASWAAPDRLPAQEPADLLLYNGKVFAADVLHSTHEAVVIRDGRIVAVGDDGLRERYRARREVNLAGRLVTPGFIDTHIHIRSTPRRQADLAGASSMDELKERIAEKARLLGPGKWITARAWSEDELAEQRRPLRRDLDEAAPDNPVWAVRAGSHSGVANSRALEIAGIGPDTPDPDGGIIEHDDRGRPNGVLRESAKSLVESRIPEPDDTEEQLLESHARNLRDLLSLGITSIVDAGVFPPEDYSRWEEVYARWGEELPRASVQVRPGIRHRIAIRIGGRTAEEAIQVLRDFGKVTGDGDDRLQVGPLKMTVDGGYTGPAAYTLEPYRGEPDYFGVRSTSREDFFTVSKAAHEMGWQMGVHTIGDAAIAEAVEDWARMLEESPRADHRHYLNHFTVKPPEATMRLMAEHDIHVSQQPNFTYTLEGRYVANLSPARAATNNPLRSAMDRGIFMAFGSDVLPIGPLVGIYAAVTRKGMTGESYAASREAISMPEALVAYTRNGAYLTRQEEIKGTIEVGKLADLVVLSDDLLTIDPERILDVEIEMTIVDGDVLYERGSPAATEEP